MFQTLLNTPVKMAKEDLGFALYTLNRLHVLEPRSSDCWAGQDRGLRFESLLLSYLENLWIDEINGETISPVATVRDAIDSAIDRQLQIMNSATSREDFLIRRQQAFRRSFAIEVSDPNSTVNSWNEVIHVNVVNVSRWSISWDAWYAGARNFPPELWFQTRADEATIRFLCSRAGEPNSSVIASGQRVSLSCRRASSSSGQADKLPELSALTAHDNWAVHPHDSIPGMTAESIDVDVATAEVFNRVDSFVANRTCADRGSCEIEKEKQIEDRGLLSRFWPIELGGLCFGVVIFLIMRAATKLSGLLIASAASAFLFLLSIALAGALIIYFAVGHGGGFALPLFSILSIALQCGAVSALIGVWIAQIVSSMVATKNSDRG